MTDPVPRVPSTPSITMTRTGGVPSSLTAICWRYSDRVRFGHRQWHRPNGTSRWLAAVVDPDDQGRARYEARGDAEGQSWRAGTSAGRKSPRSATCRARPKRLTDRAIAWGKRSKGDDGAPEALALAVKTTRYGCDWHGGHGRLFEGGAGVAAEEVRGHELGRPDALLVRLHGSGVAERSQRHGQGCDVQAEDLAQAKAAALRQEHRVGALNG